MLFTNNAAWLILVLTLPGLAKTPATSSDISRAAVARQAPVPGRQFFFSWGYNGDNYTKSDMHFSQPSLNSDFTLFGVQARDSKAWTELTEHGLFVPQYNIRFGMFFNEKWGIELALDHIKWIVRDDQQVRMTGKLNGTTVDTQLALTPEVIEYQLNNGANPIFVNLIRRVRLAGESGHTGHVAFLAKAGGGFAVPHTENKLFGEPNDKGFQFFHGWNLDAGVAVRVHLWKPIYFEFEDKFVYARYFGVKIDQGTASHSVKANEFIWNFGLAFGK